MLKKLLALFTLIPLATHAAAEKAEALEHGLEIGKKVCNLQKQIEDSLFATIIPITAIDQGTNKQIPKELLRIIYDYRFPTMDDLRAAANNEALIKKADIANEKYFKLKSTILGLRNIEFRMPILDIATRKRFEAAGFETYDVFPVNHMRCKSCRYEALVMPWMVTFQFHGISGGLDSKKVKACKKQRGPDPDYGTNIPNDPTALRNYLLCHFYAHIRNQWEGGETSLPHLPQAIWKLLMLSSGFGMGERQWLEAYHLNKFGKSASSPTAGFLLESLYNPVKPVAAASKAAILPAS